MSQHSNRPSIPPKSPPTQTRRPGWLAVALLALAGIALVSTLTWLVQRSAAVPAQHAPTQAAPADTAPAGGAPAGGATASGPRIEVDQERIDYGDVKLNTTIETTIRVKNTGSEVLALDQNPVVELIEGC